MPMSRLAKCPPDRLNQHLRDTKKADPSLMINALPQIVCKMSVHFTRSCQHKEPDVDMPNLLKKTEKASVLLLVNGERSTSI